MNYMVIDIGSNTVKYDIFSLCENLLEETGHRSTAVRLIRYIENGALSEKGEEALCLTLKDYTEDAKRKKCREILAFATAGFRRLSDPSPLIDRISEKIGVRIRLLSGEEEGLCGFLGMQMSCKPLPAQGVMLDMGGGSTEISLFKGKNAFYIHSCPFGALSLKNSFGVGVTVTPEQKKKICAHVQSLVPARALSDASCGKTAVLVGGTAKACAALGKLFFNSRKNILSMSLFEKLSELFEHASEDELEKIRALMPDRYELMAAGLSGYEQLLRMLGTEKIIVCQGGIREGYLAFAIGRKDLSFKK